jgi:hypothetical protein
MRWCVNTAELARCQAKSPRRLQSLERRRRGEASGVVTVTMVVSGYRAPPGSLMAIIRKANSAKELRFRTPAKLYVYDTLLERLPQDLKDVAAALGPCIQEEHAMVGQRHLARQRHLAATDQPRIRDGMMRGTKRAGCDHCGAVAREASDAMDARGLKSLGEGHRRQDGGEPPCQHRDVGGDGMVNFLRLIPSLGTRVHDPRPLGF